MPFCVQCGNQVAPTDTYCARCGLRQRGEAVPDADPLARMQPRTASLLCYVPLFGWVMSVIILATARFRQDRTVRFHAFQGLYLFVAYLITTRFLIPVFGHLPGSSFLEGFVAHVLQLAVFGTWIFMLIKTSQGEMCRLPVIGELAEKSVTETA